MRRDSLIAAQVRVAREIREHFGPLSPLLIGVSGVWTGTSDRLLGKVVGFDHYLLKPSDPAFIRNLLEPLRSSSSAKGGTKTEECGGWPQLARPGFYLSTARDSRAMRPATVPQFKFLQALTP